MGIIKKYIPDCEKILLLSGVIDGKAVGPGSGENCTIAGETAYVGFSGTRFAYVKISLLISRNTMR